MLEAIQIASLEIDSIEKGIRTADHDKDIRDSEKESEEGRLREAAMELVCWGDTLSFPFFFLKVLILPLHRFPSWVSPFPALT